MMTGNIQKISYELFIFISFGLNMCFTFSGARVIPHSIAEHWMTFASLSREQASDGTSNEKNALDERKMEKSFSKWKIYIVTGIETEKSQPCVNSKDVNVLEQQQLVTWNHKASVVAEVIILWFFKLTIFVCDFTWKSNLKVEFHVKHDTILHQRTPQWTPTCNFNFRQRWFLGRVY